MWSSVRTTRSCSTGSGRIDALTLPWRGRVGSSPHSGSCRGGVTTTSYESQMAPRSIQSFRRETARRLRAQSTDAESRLWRHLRCSPLMGSHFRRQVSMGRYIADFACMAARLVIGSQHADPERLQTDRVRTAWFRSQGYRVIRFWNNEITENIEGVLEAIYVELYGSRETEAIPLKHQRRPRLPLEAETKKHPTPARYARRPSPSRGG